MRNLLLVVMSTLLLWSCSHDPNHTHQQDNQQKSTTEDDHHETESLTLYSDNFEVFVGFDVLMAGHESEFLIHVTKLDAGYTAFTGGTVKVILNIDDQLIKKTANPAEVDGILTTTMIPQKTGFGSLTFEIQTDSAQENLSTDHIHVYSENETEIHNHGSSASDLVKFTKEQAWKSEFNVIEVESAEFSNVITTSGEFLAMPGEKQNVIAKSQGIVLFATRNLVQGRYVNKGDVLFTLSSQGMTENNIMVKYNEAVLNFEKSKSTYFRHKELLSEKIISEKQFLESKSQYVSDSIYYYSLKESASSQGMKVLAPRSGYIHELNVSEGQYVVSGNLMATISTNKVILLRADLPQQYYKELGKISTTNFRPAYSSRVYTLDELSGELIARGASVAENNHYMPIYFEIVNDGTILEGASAEFYLKTNPEPGHLVIPVSSLIEEQGSFYVFVQISGEEFQKRAVELAANDGIRSSVASGLIAGERIVSEGAMLLKMASLSSIPVHSHSH